MADPNDIQAAKLARREFTKRQIDLTLADIHVSHGLVTIRGVVRALRGGPPDVRAEVELVARLLRAKPEIRDVVVDCIYRS